MAFTIIAEPDMQNANPDEWRIMIQALEIFSLGLLSVEIENLNTGGIPRIRGVIEVNGRKYKRDGFDSVSGSPVSNARNFIYAVPNGNEMSLSYSSAVPTSNAVKGGWYNGNNRAIALFYGNEYRGKRVIGGITDDLMPLDIGDVTSGGTSVSIPGYVANTKNTYTVTLPRGWYWAELTSGKGGGNGENGSLITGGIGGVASVSKTVNKTFFIESQKTVTIKIGGDGFNGGNGGYGTLSGTGQLTDSGGGGGGGSGSGEESIICELFITTGDIAGGIGGWGGNSDPIRGFGGGGGGGLFGGLGGLGGSGGVGEPGIAGLGIGGGVGTDMYGGSGGNGGGAWHGYGGIIGISWNGSNGSNGEATGGGGGGGGGGMGAHGRWRADGGPGGSCSIRRLF
jgi:hypothetical protein